MSLWYCIDIEWMKRKKKKEIKKNNLIIIIIKWALKQSQISFLFAFCLFFGLIWNNILSFGVVITKAISYSSTVIIKKYLNFYHSVMHSLLSLLSVSIHSLQCIIHFLLQSFVTRYLVGTKMLSFSLPSCSANVYVMHMKAVKMTAPSLPLFLLLSPKRHLPSRSFSSQCCAVVYYYVQST